MVEYRAGEKSKNLENVIEPTSSNSPWRVSPLKIALTLQFEFLKLSGSPSLPGLPLSRAGEEPMIEDTFESHLDEIPEDLVEGDSTLPEARAPEHPGTILKGVFLENHNLTQNELAQALNTYPQQISELVNGRKNITPQWAY